MFLEGHLLFSLYQFSSLLHGWTENKYTVSTKDILLHIKEDCEK